jgi:type III restriction enzyme
MIVLKNYQQNVLDSLQSFFRQCSRDEKPEQAFMDVQRKNGFYPEHYLSIPVSGLTGVPYVCLRVPTGGGKTLIACHAAGLAIHELLQAERAVVLWLVPSNTILDQTADALRNPRHPYRQALELSCGSVEVLTIEEALHLSRASVDGQTVVIVSTIQSFRVEDTTGRQVYSENGAFSEHLQNLSPGQIATLLKEGSGKPIPSLVNMLRLRRPVVIVDEAHNARTELSFSTLGNLLPSCIIEFTATPDRTKNPSNVLHRVSAAELKAANMIKLPLRVITRDPSQRDQLLADAITIRADLEKRAVIEGQKTREYIRPIMLIQAERVDNCEPLRERLVIEFNIPKEQIKISVGKLDDLKNLPDINLPASPVRIIITVEKLREGWDCPFAYVLCSLKETHSATAIEQIVGRILRLPHAQAKQNPDLNCAFALSVSHSMPEVLNELREALESNGFTTAEAERIIVPASQGALPLGTHEQTVQFIPGQEIDAEVAQIQIGTLNGKVRIDTENGQIQVLVPLDAGETERLLSCVKTTDAKAKITEMVALVAETEKAFGGTGLTRVPTPYELHLDFVVPLLSVAENGKFFDFESTYLIEHAWQLSAKDASLSENYNPLSLPVSKAGMIDVSQTGKIETSVVQDGSGNDYVTRLHQAVLEFGMIDWTPGSLVAWLDRNINHQDIPVAESAVFLHNAVRGIMTKFGIADVSLLALDRYRLRDEIEIKIQQHRMAERKNAFQRFLLPDSPLAVSEGRALNFSTISYDPSFYYDGSYIFKKHYFPPKPGELQELTPNGELTEECACAQFIDDMPEVKFWVRNLARKTSSFRLQTSKDWFYPDFLVQLNDGRVLVVEYKGGYLYDAADAEEKRMVGEVWASRSNGKCLFIMPSSKHYQEIKDFINKI